MDIKQPTNVTVKVRQLTIVRNMQIQEIRIHAVNLIFQSTPRLRMVYIHYVTSEYLSRLKNALKPTSIMMNHMKRVQYDGMYLEEINKTFHFLLIEFLESYG